MKLLSIFAGSAAALLFCGGCASISVTGVQRGGGPVQRPSTIYVADYDTRDGQWNITSRSLSHEQFKQQAANSVAEALVKDLNTYVGPAVRVGSARSVPPGAWLVTGRFIRVSEGNPAGRILIGLGAGGSKMETETTIFQGSARGVPFLRFGTTGGSNAMPGMLLSTGPSGAVISGVSQSMRGMRDDSHRTAKMITASIAEYLVQRGWLSTAGVKVKKPGEFQLLQMPTTPPHDKPQH